MSPSFRSLSAYVLAVAGGCSAGSEFDGTDVLAPDALGLVRVDVFPPADSDLTDDRGEPLNLRPATFFVEAEGNALVDLTLRPAVPVGGSITGLALTPFASHDLPTVPLPLGGAEIRFGVDSAVQQPRTTTDDRGIYSVLVVPESLDYDMAIVPATPDIPVTWRKVQVSGQTRILDVFVDAGVPVWGRVEDTLGRPVSGARVRLIDARGVASAAATTDTQGRYLIAAQPGESYVVIFEGRNAQDPVVRVRSGPVSDVGVEVPLMVGDLDVGAVTGRVLGPTGRPLGDDDAQVRLIATSLDGLEDAGASYEIVVGVEDGVFTAVVPDGTYRIEVAPQTLEGPAPRVLEEVPVRGAVTRVGDVPLDAAGARFGWVTDEAGAPVGGAAVRCTEIGFAGRTWNATTDPLGQFLLQLPATPVSCSIAPPSSRPDLALSRQDVEGAASMEQEVSWDLTLRAGSLLSGGLQVFERADLDPDALQERFPLAGAVLEVRDDGGELLGIAISDPDGLFQLRIDR